MDKLLFTTTEGHFLFPSVYNTHYLKQRFLFCLTHQSEINALWLPFTLLRDLVGEMSNCRFTKIKPEEESSGLSCLNT